MNSEESFYRRELAASEAEYGPGHPDVSKHLNNLAVLLSRQGRFAEAEPLFRRCLAIIEVAFGLDHPTVAVTLANLARALNELSRYEEAVPLYRRSLPIFEATSGPDHPRVAVTLAYLASTLKELSRYEEAVPLYRRALAISEATLGPDHPQVAAIINDLAEIESAGSPPVQGGRKGGVTLFDQHMNYVLLGMEFSEESTEIRLSNRKGVLSEVDMQSYQPQELPGTRLLDDLVIFAESPQDYFEIMTTCASLANQPNFVNGEPLLEPFAPLYEGKRAFFASTREQSGIGDARYFSITTAGGLNFTLADVCLAFNFGSLSLLSIPAFLVMSFMGGFCQAPGNQPTPIGRWIYRFRAPGGREIRDFDDYHDTFLRGDYLKNNADVFLTTYALAHAIAVFAEEVQSYEDATSFRDFYEYEPLAYVLESLVRRGALRDPFGSELVWKTCPTGIENAEEANPDLAATLLLTGMLAPIATTTVTPHAILQVFYGLIDTFSLRGYFGIDRGVKFEYPTI